MSKRTDVAKALRDMPSTTLRNISIGNQTVEVMIRKALSADDRAAFVSAVTENVVKDGKRNYGLFESMCEKYIIKYFTDLNFACTQEDLAKLTHDTNLMTEIHDVVGEAYLHSLIEAARCQINATHRAEIAVAAALVRPDPLDRIADAVENFLMRLEDSIGGVDISALNGLTDILRSQDAAHLVADKLFDISKGVDNNGKKNTAEPVDESRADQ